MGPPLTWLGIVRLGLVQAALGSIVMLTTSTLNRVMIVELGLAALVPGALVGVHYGVQIARPLWGYGSDRGGRRTPWIIGGVALLAAAGTGAAVSVALMGQNLAIGLALAIADFVLIGVGIGAAGTSLLALLASRTTPARRPAAATLVWMMMILGIAMTGVAAGSVLDPFSMGRLIAVTAATGLLATALTALAVLGIEQRGPAAPEPVSAVREPRSSLPFRTSLADTWSDPQARLFTIFVFVSMLAYSMQDLILEPYAGLAFAMAPGATTRLSGIQNGGVFAGMLLAGIGGSLLGRSFPSIVRHFTAGGCLLSAAALAALASGAHASAAWPLQANVFALGFANGIFAVAAVAAMMALAGAGGPARVGLRMGLWGGAQAVGFGLGTFSGTVVVDLLRASGVSAPAAYVGAFLLEALVFVAAAAVAIRISIPRTPHEEAGRDIAARCPAGLQAAE